MAKIKWKGSALLGPVPPTMVTCRSGDKQNVLTVAWTGITNTHPPKTYISIRPTRHSYKLIRESGVFAINLTTKDLARAADWCGTYTGAKVDKLARCNLAIEEAAEIDCPILADAPVSLECRVTDVIPLGTHDMFLADIVSVNVEEALLDKEGRLCLEKAGLVAYAHGEYFELGRPIGRFGFAVKKKSKSTSRHTK